MPKPREVFDHPDQHRSFLTLPNDSDFESQHFDRKEAGQISQNGTATSSQVQKIIENVKECISAFANANVEGGLLVLGIASDGMVKGVKHLNEGQVSSITNFDNLLVHQSAEVRFYDCEDATGNQNCILLIYAPYTERAICETPGRNPHGWMRSGPQNVPLTQMYRDRLQRNKFIVDFENTPCCDFNLTDIDQDVLSAFRRVFWPDSARRLNDEELLYEAGAIIRSECGYRFTNAGLLFFAANPQRVMSSAFIRLIRFGSTSTDQQGRGLPTLDKPFSGSVTKQIRDTRTFFKESGFFKIYQRRKPDGGFIEEYEYPQIAIDEALVNAVTHRDYATGRPIECESYQDAFIVRNPGRMIQRDRDLPDEFTLADQILDSTPRNPKLLRWLQIMKDPEGRAFVQAISEGTRRMKSEMLALNLPAPIFRLTDNQTALKLISNAKEREASLSSSTNPTTEFANIYPLHILQSKIPVNAEAFRMRYKEFLITFRDVLQANGWYIDRFSFSRIIAHRRGNELNIPQPVSAILRIYPGYEFQVLEFFGNHYLCVDYRVQVLNIFTMSKLLKHFQAQDFQDRHCVANKDGWHEGKIVAISEDWATILFFHTEKETKVPTSAVIPSCSIRMLEFLLQAENVNFDLPQTIKKYSLASETAAARKRAERVTSIIVYAADTLFPISFGDFSIHLHEQPAQLVEYPDTALGALVLHRLPEPAVEFREHKSTPDVRDGITRFGTYDDIPHTIELVPICISSYRRNMEQLIERLKLGKYKYRGSERTFATRFTYSGIVTVDQAEDINAETGRLLGEHPEWKGNELLNRIFLVHTPEAGYSADDESSPYYVVKRQLLENGIPCQMVNTPTLLNTDYKDLNLALNITAKCGVTPWVLPDAIPDADFFIGLSYTQTQSGRKVMGFANVFNKFGKWEFYSGNTASFDYEDRTKKFAELVTSTLHRLALSETPNIIFHYSAKFSREDRTAILKAARKIRPQGTFTFIWVNSHHNLRIFDSRPETDGSLRRGSYIKLSPNQILLSTTGYNPFRRAMGTPKPLLITAWVERPEGIPNAALDMRCLAVQVLSLTKLNWASTDAFTGEPITLKYAGNIAYLTAAFLRQTGNFKLHSALERTPWFL